jgi:16S rRNA (uracil1498-N3)-methyltransferase
MIGPEGDFTEKEVKNSINNKFNLVSLGNSRLRAETAGIYACTAFSLIK